MQMKNTIKAINVDIYKGEKGDKLLRLALTL